MRKPGVVAWWADLVWSLESVWRSCLTRRVPVPVVTTSRGLTRFVSVGSRRFWRCLLVVLAIKCVTVPLTFAAWSIWAKSAKAEMTAAATKLEGTVDSKTVTGQVGAVTKRSISVEYSQTANGGYEMLLPLAKDVRFEHLKDLTELKRGDTVTVTYDQTWKEGDKGERVILKTVATTISLVKRAPKQALRSREGG